MVSSRIGRHGINFVDPALIPLVQYDSAYREVGAVIWDCPAFVDTLKL